VDVAVGPQYDTTHVYVAPQDFDRFVASVIATFGGTTAQEGVATDSTPEVTLQATRRPAPQSPTAARAARPAAV